MSLPSPRSPSLRPSRAPLLLAARLLAAPLLAAPLAASTWVVDANNGPGTQFLDIQAAIHGSAPGDILLVRPGAYAGFTVDRRLTIAGTGLITAGPVLVRDTTPFARVAIAGVQPSSIVVQNCQAGVVIQDFGNPSSLVVSASSDVRVARGLVTQTAPGATGFVCDASVVELVDVIVRGGAGSAALPAPLDQGGLGTHVRGGSLVSFFKSCSFGGAGSVSCGALASVGGHGVVTEPNSLTQCFASSFAIFQGGPGGTDSCATDCANNQLAGTALVAGGQVLESGMTIDGPDSTLGASCTTVPGIASSGAGGVSSVPEQPVWTMAGVPAPGFLVTFTLTGPPGAQASFEYARALATVPTGVALVWALVRIGTTIPLGTIPASGTLTHTMTLSPLMANGGFLTTQAQVVMPITNEIRLSNSVPIVLR